MRVCRIHMDTHKAKILVVDDEANVLFTMSYILGREGYDVDAVDGGALALKAIHETNYDVVLTDLNIARCRWPDLAVLRRSKSARPIR
jgi:DNA-binding NtrC family response regulator